MVSGPTPLVTRLPSRSQASPLVSPPAACSDPQQLNSYIAASIALSYALQLKLYLRKAYSVDATQEAEGAKGWDDKPVQRDTRVCMQMVRVEL